MAVPISANVTITIDEDTPRVLTTLDFPFTPGDAGDVLTFVKITILETKGALKLDGVDVILNQVVTSSAIEAGSLVYTPALNAFATPYTTFSFMVGDGTEYSLAKVFTINVTSVTDTAPTSSNVTIGMNENTTRVLTVDDFPFTDTDGGTSLTEVQIITLPTNGKMTLNEVTFPAGKLILATDIAAGKLKFIPDYNENGTPYCTFTFKISDGQFLSTSAYTTTVNVVIVNDAPVGTNYSIIVSADTMFNGTLPVAVDPEGDSMTYHLDSAPTYGICTLATSGVFTYAPSSNYTGSDSFTYKVVDTFGAFNVYTVTVLVTNTKTSIPFSAVTTIVDVGEDLSSSLTAIAAGTGAFDGLMTAINAHLAYQFYEGRIKGTDYATVYLGAMQVAITQAVTFVLQKPIAEKQTDSEAAKKALIERQTKGFDDDAKQKLMKQMLDSWSVAYSVAKDANSIPDSIKVNPIDSVTKSAMDALGIANTNNPMGEI